MSDPVHFDYPFRFAGSRAVVNDQDSIEDVLAAAQVILRTPVGFRPETPEFGRPEFSFKIQPVGADFVAEIITSQDPRADVLVTEHPDILDDLVDVINIEIGTTGEVS